MGGPYLVYAASPRGAQAVGTLLVSLLRPRLVLVALKRGQTVGSQYSGDVLSRAG